MATRLHRQDRAHLAPLVAAELARLEAEGFAVTRIDDHSVALQRHNGWDSHILGAILGGLLGGGINPSPRTQRVWVHLLPDGGCETRLYEPRALG